MLFLKYNFATTTVFLDQSTNLYYYGARYYDPQLGRFTQADTIVPEPANPQSFNRYSYCDNNPINYTDPTGHWKLKDWIGHIVGGVMGVIGTIASGGNVLAGLQIYSFVSSGINSAISGDFGAFAIGTAASIALGPLCSGIASTVAKATVGMGETFLRGALIGAAEFGAGGFISGFATEYARTGSGSAALRGAAWGAAGGAILGAAIEGSYVAGWQNSAHGLDLGRIKDIDTAAKTAKFANKVENVRERAQAYYYKKAISEQGSGLSNEYNTYVMKKGLAVNAWDSPIKQVRAHNDAMWKWLQPTNVTTDIYGIEKMEAWYTAREYMINDPDKVWGGIGSLPRDALEIVW